MPNDLLTVPAAVHADVETLWRFHRIDDDLRPVDLAIGLGSHDPGVPVYTAELWKRGLFPMIVFTGANAPTTVERFPRGEAVHYREIALDHGVPDDAIIVEPTARHTGENIDFARQLVAQRGISVQSILVTCRPYQQRRARATARGRWPGVAVLCSAAQQSLDEYVASIGDPDRVVSMLVGDTQRLRLYAEAGEAAAEDIPESVQLAYERLVDAGYTDRLIPG